MKQFTHNQNGFTLVEVIVVAVIVAILAAVAIPQYQAYVDQNRQQAVDNLAESGAAIANSLIRRKGIDYVVQPTDLGLSYDDKKYSVSISGDSVIVTEDLATGAKKSSKAFK